MSNMSYCRFENTLADLQDCSENLRNKLSDREKKARQQLVELCGYILEELGADIDNNEVMDLAENITEDESESDDE